MTRYHTVLSINIFTVAPHSAVFIGWNTCRHSNPLPSLLSLTPTLSATTLTGKDVFKVFELCTTIHQFQSRDRITFVNEFSCLRNLRKNTLTFLKATTDPPSCRHSWPTETTAPWMMPWISLQHIHQHLNRWAFHQGNTVLLNNPQRRRLPTPSVQIYRKQQLWFGSQLLLTTHFGVPQGCVSSPYLFSLHSTECIHPPVGQIEVGGDTLVFCLIEDELA